MRRPVIREAIINQDILRKAVELEEEIKERLARLPVPPCVPPEMADMMRQSAPILAWCLAVTMKEMSARWN